MWGGGGKGQESIDGVHGGPGGGAGGYLEKLIPVDATSTCTVTIGHGGTWTTGDPQGGDTTVTCGAATVTVPGGSGAGPGNVGGAGGDPGPYGVPGGAGQAGPVGQPGAGGLQTGGGDLSGMAGNGGAGGDPTSLSSSAGAPGLAIIHAS
jgi:hypothetical protein